MIELDYKNRFSYSFSHLNKFINNDDGTCNLLEKYFTIHNKIFVIKLLIINNIIDILDITFIIQIIILY